MSDKIIELKKCPFCGAEAKMVENLYKELREFGGQRMPDWDSFYVQCTGCHIVPNGWGNSDWDSKEEAAKVWNTRHIKLIPCEA